MLQDILSREVKINKLSHSRVHMAPLQAVLQALGPLVVNGIAMRSLIVKSRSQT